MSTNDSTASQSKKIQVTFPEERTSTVIITDTGRHHQYNAFNPTYLSLPQDKQTEHEHLFQDECKTSIPSDVYKYLQGGSN